MASRTSKTNINVTYFIAKQHINEGTNILQVHKVYIYIYCVLLHTHQLPDMLNKLSKKNREIHKYRRRQQSVLHVPITKYTASANSLRFKGVKVYNL